MTTVLVEFEALAGTFLPPSDDENVRLIMEAGLRFATDNAVADPVGFEARDVKLAEKALSAWESEHGATEQEFSEEGATLRFNLGVCLSALGIALKRRDCFERARPLFERTAVEANAARDAQGAPLHTLRGRALRNLAMGCFKLMVITGELNARGLREFIEACAEAAESFEKAGDAESHAEAKQNEGEGFLYLVSLTRDARDGARAVRTCGIATHLMQQLFIGRGGRMDDGPELTEEDLKRSEWVGKGRNSIAAGLMMTASCAESQAEMVQCYTGAEKVYGEVIQWFEGENDVEAARAQLNKGFALLGYAGEDDPKAFAEAMDLFTKARDQFQKSEMEDEAARAEQARAGAICLRDRGLGKVYYKVGEQQAQAAISARAKGAASEEIDFLMEAERSFSAAGEMFAGSSAPTATGKSFMMAGSIQLGLGQLTQFSPWFSNSVMCFSSAASAFGVAKDANGQTAANEQMRIALEELHQRAEGRKFDKRDQPVPSRVEQEKGEQISREPGAEGKTVLVDKFDEAVGVLKSRLVPTVTDQDIEELNALIHGAQQSAPVDKVGFVRDMRRMLEAGGLELQVEGELNRVKLTMKNGSIALAISRKGTVGFHGRAIIRVVRADGPEFTSWPSTNRLGGQALD